jgi:hypothetical protein
MLDVMIVVCMFVSNAVFKFEAACFRSRRSPFSRRAFYEVVKLHVLTTTNRSMTPP